MKYMITNGNEYLQYGCDKSGRPTFKTVDELELATRFKFEKAMQILKDHFAAHPKWGLRRLSKGVFIITTGNLYVTNTSANGITNNYNKAKWFRSVSDAEVYISKAKTLFDDPVIIGEDGHAAELTERKRFTPEQLKVLGIAPENKTKRIQIQKTTRQLVYEKCNGICGICHGPVLSDNFTIDHIVPLSRGGKNEIENLRLACYDCNRNKGNRTDKEMVTSFATILSESLIDDPDKELEDMLVRAAIRSKIRGIFAGTIYENRGN